VPRSAPRGRERVAAARARRAADERAQLAARAWEDAEDAKRVYESALGMHGRAFAVAERARASFAAAAAEIERQKAEVFELLGVMSGTREGAATFCLSFVFFVLFCNTHNAATGATIRSR
jgi:hypothetical protein